MIGFEGAQGLIERGWKSFDTGTLLVTPCKDILINRTKTSGGRIDLIADTVQSSHKHGTECQVDVAGGVGGAELQPGCIGLVGVLGNANRGATVAQRKEGIHR